MFLLAVYLKLSGVEQGPSTKASGKTTEALCLMLPGKVLHLSALLTAKKFRTHGNKEGAILAMRSLEADGLGQLEEVG